MIRGTSSGADDVIGNGKCVLSGHLREAIWMIASNNPTVPLSSVFPQNNRSPPASFITLPTPNRMRNDRGSKPGVGEGVS